MGEETEKFFVAKRSVALEKDLAAGSANLRTIEEGEALENLEGPKKDVKEGDNRVKGRVLSNGAEGWFTIGANTSPWSPQYECVQETPLQESADASEPKVVRSLEVGEFVEAVEVPKGTMIRVRAEKDNVIAYATLRNSEGAEFLKVVSRE